jgi:TRAP-type C4-dicarboxylate transport system permease small subunit|tara:strand:- start:32043 stop:32594 length:552 start_codon:yes stop_codon:yes gene_type:complete
MTASDPKLPKRLYHALDEALCRLELIALLIAATFLLTTMVLVSLDSLMRYALNKPLLFQYTLTEDYLLVGMITMSLAWGFRTGGYIRITGVAAFMPPRVAEWLLRAGLMFSAAYIATLGWKAGQEFLKTAITGEAKIGVFAWPVWASWIWIPLGLGLLALRLLICAAGPAQNLHSEHEPTEEI